jgi:adenylosuccinate synthase
MLHQMGREFGATTGRPRRCGWFDSVATRHANMVNGIDALAVTNLDGLDTVQRIQVCVAYRAGGRRYSYLPNDIDLLSRCVPVYREFPGWMSATNRARHWKDLPVQAREYLRAIAELTEAPLGIVSVGPSREQTICMK